MKTTTIYFIAQKLKKSENKWDSVCTTKKRKKSETCKKLILGKSEYKVSIFKK